VYGGELVENVRGFTTSFVKTEKGQDGVEVHEGLFNAANELRLLLSSLKYTTFVSPSLIMEARDFGVPQLRPRFILIAIQDDFLKNDPSINPVDAWQNLRKRFLLDLGLPVNRDVTLSEAISDLRKHHGTIPCIEEGMDNFQQGKLGSPESNYQRLMRITRDGRQQRRGHVADSHRFVNHRSETIERFKQIISTCRPGICLNEEERRALNINKHSTTFLAHNEPCHTLTSLPDDLIHYSEPRVLTVREYARIQSFPDWFQFKSNYTTGAEKRKEQVPRYTQVANAVPPLMAQAFGLTLGMVYLKLLHAEQKRNEQQNQQELAAIA
jgi:DNA (cytosine-5)-methyltransferase 1